VRLACHAVRQYGMPAAINPDCADFAAFAARYPALLDKRLLSRHYRSTTLAGARAHREWAEPDLARFPGTGSAS
jgi:hypothetical protein